MSKWYRLYSIYPTYWIKHLTHTHTHDLWVTLPDKCARRQPIKRYISQVNHHQEIYIFFCWCRRRRRLVWSVSGVVQNGEEFKPMCAKDQCDDFFVVVGSRKFRQHEKGNMIREKTTTSKSTNYEKQKLNLIDCPQCVRPWRCRLFHCFCLCSLFKW